MSTVTIGGGLPIAKSPSVCFFAMKIGPCPEGNAVFFIYYFFICNENWAG